MEINLIDIKEEDLEIIIKWRTSIEVTKYMFTDPVLTLENQMQWLKKIKKSETEKYWIIEVDKVKIGIYSINNINFEKSICELGYYIGETKYRKMGIMKNLEEKVCEYIFKVLKIKTIYNRVLSNNKAGILMHQKGKFELEKIEKKTIEKYNEYLDIWVFKRSSKD